MGAVEDGYNDLCCAVITGSLIHVLEVDGKVTKAGFRAAMTLYDVVLNEYTSACVLVLYESGTVREYTE